MELSQLGKVKTKKDAKRLGRGHSSGKGKTSGRGQKGQKARGKIRLGFEGGQTPLYKRVPFIRGKGNSKSSLQPIAISLTQLNQFEDGATITYDLLVERGFITKQEKVANGAKVVGTGELTKALTISIPVSTGAKTKIEQAKGTITEATQ